MSGYQCYDYPYQQPPPTQELGTVPATNLIPKAMSNFVSFRKVEVTNPISGETKEKIQVLHKDGHAYTLLTELTVEQIKADRAALLAKVVIREGEYGTYAYFTRANVLEEF